MAYRFHFERGLVRIVIEGAIDGALIASSGMALYTHPEWQSRLAELWDFTGATHIDVPPEGLRQILAVDAALPDAVGPGRTATLVASDDMHDLALLYGMLLEGSVREHRVFWDEQEALDWLRAASLGRLRSR